MSKPWSERPLWEKCWLEPHSKVYLDAAKLIGYAGCTPQQFALAASKLPGYDKYRFDNVVRDLTVFAKREQGQLELTLTARKVLRVILGPAPDDPEYRRWWELRLISVRLMREQGQTVLWADEPPVPLEPAREEPKKEPPPEPKKRTRRKKGAA